MRLEWVERTSGSGSRGPTLAQRPLISTRRLPCLGWPMNTGKPWDAGANAPGQETCSPQPLVSPAPCPPGMLCIHALQGPPGRGNGASPTPLRLRELLRSPNYALPGTDRLSPFSLPPKHTHTLFLLPAKPHSANRSLHAMACPAGALKSQAAAAVGQAVVGGQAHDGHQRLEPSPQVFHQPMEPRVLRATWLGVVFT